MVLLKHLPCLYGLGLFDSGYFAELSTTGSYYSSVGKIFVHKIKCGEFIYKE